MEENKRKEASRRCFKCGRSPVADNVKLFRYPKPGDRNILRCTFWAKYIFPSAEVHTSCDVHRKLYNEHRMLCEHHFPDEEFANSTKTRLKMGSVPSDNEPVLLNLPAYAETPPVGVMASQSIPISNFEDSHTDLEDEAVMDVKAQSTSNIPALRKGGKVKRQATEESQAKEQHPSKRQNCGPVPAPCPRNSAKDLAVGVCRRDGKIMDDALASVIRRKLQNMIEDAMEAGVDYLKTKFATSGLVSEGFFLVTPMTEEARDWLLEVDFGDLNDTVVVVKKQHRSRVSIWLPGKQEDLPKDPLLILKYQNTDRTELAIQDWVLLSRENMPSGTRLLMGVPIEVAETWIGDLFWLCFQMTQVQAKLIREQSGASLPL